jgi:hypothetical protein
LFAFLKLIGIGKKDTANEALPYRVRDDFLSPAEMAFYRVLVVAVNGQAVICPKVNLADLFFVIQPQKNYSYRGRIAQKHVDFLLCQPQSMKPLAGIELDDSSHGRPDRQERDEFVDRVFQTAKLPLIHVPCRSGYEVEEIRRMVEEGMRGRDEGSGFGVQGRGGGAGNRGEDAGLVAPGLPEKKTLPGKMCPKCGVPMVKREGARGAFWGCPNYPKCRQTMAGE